MPFMEPSGRAVVEGDDSHQEGNVQELRALYRGLPKGMHLRIEQDQCEELFPCGVRQEERRVYGMRPLRGRVSRSDHRGLS